MTRVKLLIFLLMLAMFACAVQSTIHTLPPQVLASRSMSTDDFYLRHVSRHGVLQIDARKPRE